MKQATWVGGHRWTRARKGSELESFCTSLVAFDGGAEVGSAGASSRAGAAQCAPPTATHPSHPPIHRPPPPPPPPRPPASIRRPPQHPSHPSTGAGGRLHFPLPGLHQLPHANRDPARPHRTAPCSAADSALHQTLQAQDSCQARPASQACPPRAPRARPVAQSDPPPAVIGPTRMACIGGVAGARHGQWDMSPSITAAACEATWQRPSEITLLPPMHSSTCRNHHVMLIITATASLVAQHVEEPDALL